MELLRFLESMRDFGKTRNDTATVAVNTDGAAFPVTFAGFIGMFQLPEQGIGNAIDALVIVFIA
jgi:hypothetical protein